MRGRSVKAICLVFGMALVWSAVCEAQGLKIGFVDFAQFANKSKKAQALQKKLVRFVSQKRAELEKKKKELLELRDQLQKQGPMLKEETRNAKIKELGIKEMELKLLQKEAESAFRNEQKSAQEVFERDVSKVISAIRKQKGLTIVLNSTAILSVEDRLNITDEVARAYDAQASTARPAAPRRTAPRAAPRTTRRPAAPAKSGR